MQATLYWGDFSLRQGWWLGVEGKEQPLMVHGPSICKSSGGGPKEALIKANKDYPEYEKIIVEPPETHSYFPTRMICTHCKEEAEQLNAQGLIMKSTKMLNGDLIVAGKRADECVPENFKTCEELVGWEMGSGHWEEDKYIQDVLSIYDALDAKMGEKHCERNNVNHIEDVFGEEFGQRFRKWHRKLLAQWQLTAYYKERDQINKTIAELEEEAAYEYKPDSKDGTGA